MMKTNKLYKIKSKEDDTEIIDKKTNRILAYIWNDGSINFASEEFELPKASRIGYLVKRKK